MQSKLRTRFQLELLRKLREKKNPLQQGFTLVELMIVVAIIGILSAIGLPQFLGARNAATAGALVGEATGRAKECATYVASQGIGTVDQTTNANLTAISCSTSAGSYTTRTFSSVSFKCVGQDLTGTKAVVTVNGNGQLGCSTGT